MSAPMSISLESKANRSSQFSIFLGGWLRTIEESANYVAERLRPESLIQCLAVSVVVLSVSFFLYAPNLWMPLCDGRCQDALAIAASPLRYGHLNYPFAANRVMLPWLSHLLHFTRSAVFAVPILANVLNFALCFRMLSVQMNTGAGLLCTAALAITQVGQVGNTWVGWPDPLCLLLLTLTMTVRWSWWLFPLVVAGVLTDDRFLVGLLGSILWRLYVGPESRLPVQVAARALVPPLIAGMLGWIIAEYLLHRGYIGPAVRDATTRDIFYGSYVFNWWHRPLAVLFSFRWFWLAPCAVVLTGRRIVKRLLIPICVLAASCFVLTLPGDMTRSMAVAFPLVLLFCVMLDEGQPILARKIFTATLFFNVVTPMLYIFQLSIWPAYPLPLVLWRTLHASAGGYRWPIS